MNKKLIITVITLISIAFSISACGKDNSQNTNTSNEYWTPIYNEPMDYVYDFRDPNTGIHYLVFYRGGEIEITPRLANTEGNIMQD